MSTKISTQYPGRAEMPTANYPTGSFKNRSFEGAEDGTPLDQTWANDMLGFRDALLKEGGVVANGVADTAENSQALEAAKNVFATRADLADPAKGAGMVTLKGGRTVQEWAGERINLLDYLVPGGDDNSAAMQAAADEARSKGLALWCPKRSTIHIAAPVDLTGIPFIKIDANISAAQDMGGPAIDIGALVGISNGARISLADVTNGTSTISAEPPPQPLVRISGVNGGKISLGACNYLQLYADSGANARRLMAYNEINLLGAISLLEITDSGAPSSYVNENTINALRVIRYRIMGVGYGHNHNILNGGTFEGSSVHIEFDRCSHNYIIGARFESVSGSPGIEFSDTTYSNRVWCSWSGVGNPRNAFSVSIPVSDMGYGNSVGQKNNYEFDKTRLIALSAASLIVANSNDSATFDDQVKTNGISLTRAVLTPHLDGFTCGSNRTIATSDLIPVSSGDVIEFDCAYEGASLRSYIVCYDENQMVLKLEGPGGAFISQANTSMNTATGEYRQTTNLTAQTLNNSPAAIARKEVRFIKVSLGCFVAGTMFKLVSAHIWTQPAKRNLTEISAAIKSVPVSMIGKPTFGFVPIGVAVYDRSAKVWYTVSFSHETSLTSAALQGATAITVDNATGVQDGDVVGIRMSNGMTHWSVVSAKTGNMFTVQAMPNGSPAGARVVFNRWE